MRIIAGKYKSRILRDLTHEGTRPTADRVREALFSKLQTDIKGGIVLDLFSGTGALGLEALSRGAKKAYLVDDSKISYNLIKENNNLLGENASIINADYAVVLNNFADKNLQFNVIFLDPPYKTDFAQKALEVIAKNNLLAENGIIVFEHDKENLNINMPKGLLVYDQKRYGITYLTYITSD
jgi:16S rRNA (guanine966-N2)-methyltransferase